jgi:CBS domain-containing protein
MIIADLIGDRQEVFTVREDGTVHDAARYLRDRKVRSVGVVDASGRLVGVLSQSDISNKVCAENQCPAWIRVGEIMSTELITVTTDMDVGGCLGLLEQHGIHHLPALTPSGQYRGMVSVSDLLRVVVRDEKSRADLLSAMVFSTH